MFRRFRYTLWVAVIAGGTAMAQNSTGNILQGQAKANVLKQYSGNQALPKPDRILIHDFAVPVDVSTDKSVAGQLHRTIMLRHGVDEDSSPEALTKRVQAAFSKALAEELKKANISTVHVPGQKT